MAKPFKSIPGPRGLPLIGNALDYSKLGKNSFERLHLAKRANYAKFGEIYKEKLGPGVNIVQVFNPDEVGTILQSDGKWPMRPAIPITIAANKRDAFPLGLGSLNGEPWYKLRSSVQKYMMQPRAVSAYLPAQNQVANDFLTILDMHSIGNLSGVKAVAVQNLETILLKYTMESIGIVCFGTRLGCMSAKLEEGSVAHRMFNASNKLFDAVQKTTFDFPWYFLFRTKLYKQFCSSKQECDKIAESYIKDALKTIFVHHFNPPAPDSNSEVSCSFFLKTLLTGEKLEIETVVGIVTELFTAGIDSTANALSFLLYNLSCNPQVQDKLYQEITNVLGQSAEVRPDHLDTLPYLKAVVKESFRLNYPVEGGTTRILAKDMVISGYQVPQKTIVAFNNQTMCLQSEYFQNPEKFLPERWLKLGTASLNPPPRFVMLPFGHGPRMCIGRRFAEQELYLALIKIVQHFTMQYVGEEDVGMLNRVFTVPDKPIQIVFRRR